MTEPTQASSRRMQRESQAELAREQRSTPKRRKRWPWIAGTVTLLVILIAVVAVTAWAGKRVYDQAMEARSHLMAAMPYVTEIKTAMLNSDLEAASAAAAAFAGESAKASQATNGRLWGFAEDIPLPIMENLRAVRAITTIADDLSDSVLRPASGLDIRALAPAGGGIDIAALQALAGVIDQVLTGVDSSQSSLASIQRKPLIAQVEAGVVQVEDALNEIQNLVGPAQKTLSVLPNALGANGAKNYLLMFQGNSEVRASGGSPGSFVLVQVDQGRVEIVREAASTEFPFDIPQTVIPLDEETQALYSDIIARWVSNLSSTPDFPSSAAIAQGWWSQLYDDRIDGVVSVDPIALSYFLEATGPIELPTGDVLTSENAVHLLLNEVYFEYPDGRQSNAFFAGASLSTFETLTSGKAQALPLVRAAIRSADEGRLKIWSADAGFAEVLGDTQLAGVMPTDNAHESVVGVFFNDTTGSKMDYYVDAAIDVGTDQCTTDGAPQWTAAITLANNVTEEVAADLPRYITGPYYTPGEIATDFIVYAPVGATIESWTVNGQEHPAIAHTTHLGRDAVRMSVLLTPLSSATLEVKMVGADGIDAGSYGPPGVRHTPMVRTTPVTIDAPTC